MPQAIVIQDGESGDAQLVEIDSELHTLQSMVGGDIEAADLGEIVIVMDEEGKLKGKDLNNRIMFYLYSLFPDLPIRGVIVGTVVIFGGRGGEDLADVPQSAIEYFGLD